MECRNCHSRQHDHVKTHAATRELQDELRVEGDHIPTSFKAIARGKWYRFILFLSAARRALRFALNFFRRSLRRLSNALCRPALARAAVLTRSAFSARATANQS